MIPGAHEPTDAAEALRERAAGIALGDEPWSDAEIELARSIGMDLDEEVLAFELAVAAVAVSEVEVRGADSAPPEVLRRIESQSMMLAGARRSRMHIGPVMASAAAGVALGATIAAILLAGDGARPDSIDPIKFISTHPRAVHWPWQAVDPAYVRGSIRGEAYFDPACAEGLLEIEGLLPNDPTREQYQLWIFDEARDERYPVDGGVFDVAHEGRAVLKIRSRLPVSRPIAFAVTVEKPGGVVVSDRRIAILAKP